MYSLNKLIWCIANPLSLGIAILALGVLLKVVGSFVRAIEAKRRRLSRVAWVLIMLATAWFWLWGTRACTRVVGQSLEREYLIERANVARMRPASDYSKADAIVVFGGGCGARTNFFDGVMLNAAADRAYFGAQLWKAGKAPIVVPSGVGTANSDGKFLTDLGVAPDAVVVDEAARNTEENAKFVKEILLESGGVKNGGVVEFNSSTHPFTHSPTSRPKILLVTSAWHMKRSLLMFAKYAHEIECVPAACDFECFPKRSISLADLMPDTGAFECNCRYFHEWLGIFGYRWLRGRGNDSSSYLR